MDISAEAVADYADRAVDAMVTIVTGLGDHLANTHPALPGANTPYAILRHTLGVMEFWGGQVVAGRQVARDRAAEFRASGPVADLVTAAAEAKRRFRADALAAEPGAPTRGTHPGVSRGDLEFRSQGHALLHVLEEILQHLGQVEITRDLLHQGTSG